MSPPKKRPRPRPKRARAGSPEALPVPPAPESPSAAPEAREPPEPAAPGTPWDRFWYGPVAAVRPYLLTRLMLLVLAFDIWTDLLPHAGRYGAGGFNVAHFSWLDAVQPLPSAGIYVGVLVVAGALALFGALTGQRAALAALAAAYTYGWAMSMLDGYQHHYLISLFLLAFACLPRLRAGDQARRVPAWSFRLLAVTMTIVYVFAAASKFGARWRGGSALESLAAGRFPFVDAQAMAAGMGMSSATFWTLTSAAVTLVELVIAAGYLLCVGDDARMKPWARRLRWIALASAIVLHVETIVMRLEIGWFAYYMLMAACVLLLPEAWLERAAAAPRSAARRSAEALGGLLGRPATLVLGLGLGAGGWAVVGMALDLPGAGAAGWVLATGVAGTVAVAVARGRREDGARSGLAGAGAAAACFIAVASSSARFDFYRYLGGDLRRRGDLQGALAAYEKAERFGGASQSRRKQIDDLRRRLGRAHDQGRPLD